MTLKTKDVEYFLPLLESNHVPPQIYTLSTSLFIFTRFFGFFVYFFQAGFTCLIDHVEVPWVWTLGVPCCMHYFLDRFKGFLG